MRHHLHAVPIAVVAGLALSMSTAIGFADAKPAPTTPPTQAQPANPDKACTLSPSLTHAGGELTSCLAVGTKLSSVPAVGKTATLTVTVKAARAERNTQVTIDLPKNLAFADGTATHAAYSGSGAVKRTAPATMSLAAGQSRSFTRIVKATAAGFSEIAASAKNRISSKRTDSGKDSVFFTVATTPSASRLGATPGSDVTRAAGSTARAHYSGAAPQRATTQALRSAPAAVRPARQAGPNTAGAPGTSCASGGFFYVDQVGVTRPLHNVTVQVRNSANTVLASGFTGGTGLYNVCYGTGGATTSIYLQFQLQNGVWSVQDFSNNIYSYSTGIVSVPDNSTHDFGTLQPGVANQMRAAHAFQEADDEWQWMYQFVPYQGGCWSPFETTCRSLAIHWAAGNTTQGTNWNPSRQVYLLDGSPDTLDEPVHEYGHDLMYELYGQTFPTTDCTSHDLFVTSGPVCGWTEGFPDWVATSVYNNTIWTYNGGGQRDFNVTWNEGLGYATGDRVEGRVVQAIRSLTDGTKAPWDHDAGEGGGIKDNSRIFTLMRDFRPNTFADVWSARGSEGYDVSQTALSALYQGTIDYGFRNPLGNYAGQHLPQAVPDHNYSYATSTGYWSVVALKPDAGSDVDLTVYNDFGQTATVGSSGFGGTFTDFVAVNSNSGHRALQSYYPRAHQFAGSGGYTIGVAQGSDIVSATSTRFLSSSDPTHVWDTSETAGTPVYYRAVSDSGQSLQLVSLGAGSDVLSRGSAINGTDPGAGNAATLSVTPTASGFAGLVVVNNSLTSGNVTLYKDTTAPTGSVSINNGAASTSSPNVTLTLSASDTDTGVDAMQISTDGTFDTEPVVSYATSATATLPGPNDTKTVYVRYRNNAGQWSDPVTDTILLKAVQVDSVSPASGPTTGGNTVTISGDNFTGATKVRFSSTQATSFTVVSKKKITATAPAHAAGLSNVYVTAPGGTSATVVGDRYTFAPIPVITSVEPNSGPIAGGTSVTVKGSGFTDATVVKFGSTPATSFTVVSGSKITAVAPAHSAGGTYVYVTAPGGTTAAVAADRYTYAAVPTVTGVSPSSGTSAGGQTVTITGTGLTAATAVKFGSTPATSFTVNSSTRITATTPAHAAGSANITVTTGGGTSAIVTADRYTFV